MRMRRDIIVIGASSGGLDALGSVLELLPIELPAAVFIVMHVPANPPSILHAVLQRKSRLPVFPAVDGAQVRHGVVTVAVSDHHLMFADGHLRLTRGPRENRSRPAVDATMRSAAVAFGPRCIGVVLTGNLDDGTAGLWAIKDRGGIAVVQSPEEAEYPSMPRNAIQQLAVDHVVPLVDLAGLLRELVTEDVELDVRERGHDAVSIENRIAAGEHALKVGVLSLGTPSINTCPHCHGTLTEVRDAGPLRFRCHTGHVFTPSSLLVDLDHTIDETLWSALRSIEERQLLLEQLIESAKLRGDNGDAQEYARQVEDARMRAAEIRALVMTPLPAVANA
jgi:two-component system, chemotaxis family, protein-glutamate methylesterase/glutaminase